MQRPLDGTRLPRSRTAKPLERLIGVLVTVQNRIPWLRVFVEGSAIVLSILLAFAIDASWAVRQERVVEQEALLNLKSDFQASRDNLNEILGLYERTQDEFVRFEAATPSELDLLDAEDADAIVTGLTFGGTFDPVASTVDALVRDGRLGSDPRSGDPRGSFWVDESLGRP